nr:uncharacterized protein LOC109179034 [Ipomoea batatas]
MDDNTPLGDLPHPSTEVPSLQGDPLDVAPLQTLEPESSFISFDPPTVFTELELDIPRSIRPNTTADHVAQARELVGPDVEVLAPSPGANVTEPPGDGYFGVHVLSLSYDWEEAVGVFEEIRNHVRKVSRDVEEVLGAF